MGFVGVKRTCRHNLLCGHGGMFWWRLVFSRFGVQEVSASVVVWIGGKNHY